MSKGNFEVALPKPYLTGDIRADVYEIGGAYPTAIVRTDQDWGVKIRWDLKGSMAPFICGEWCVHLRLESLGTGPEITLGTSKRIPLDPCGKGEYKLDFRVKRGKIEGKHCSIPYKPVVTLTYYTACNKPGPIAGFVELPILLFYEVDKEPIYRGNGNGRHETEVEVETEFDASEPFEVEADGGELVFAENEELELEAE